MSKAGASLAAGAIAIGVNTALLVGADLVGFTTARGGLLRLVKNVLGAIAEGLGGGGVWTSVVEPATSGQLFRSGFHVFVGLLMALFYAYLLEPWLPGRPWMKGALYAFGVWLLNAFGVLPLIGQGVAGSASLDAAGMTGFAIIHTVFFVLLGVLYARFSQRSDAAR